MKLQKIQIAIKTLIILFALLHPCQSMSQQACISTSKELTKLDTDFKKELKKYFKLSGEPGAEDYKKYLEGIIHETVPRDFFIDSKKIRKLKSLKENASFSLVWNKFSVIEEQTNKNSDFIEIEPPKTASDYSSAKRKDFYTIDTNSDLFNCLIKTTEDNEVKTLFQRIQELGGLSPGLIAQSLVELNKFEESSVRIYIGLQFYYDFIFMINGINKIE